MSLLNDTSSSAELEPRPARPWLLIGGWLLFTLGLIGIALPLLPTTVFWIGAVWCWSRSAPHLTRRILSHPRFGEPVYLFIENGEISRLGKLMALIGMSVGYALLHLITPPDSTVSLMLGFTLLLVGIWLWQRPEPGFSPLSQQRDLTDSKVTRYSSSTNLRRNSD
jgi:uncharacterized membrane protein YbaN (DUF454 family)